MAYRWVIWIISNGTLREAMIWKEIISSEAGQTVCIVAASITWKWTATTTTTDRICISLIWALEEASSLIVVIISIASQTIISICYASQTYG